MLKRSFIVGSEWLYYKIYTGPKTSDSFLVETLLPLVTELNQKKTIEKWFFIRYLDPEPHLRIRFKVPNVKELANLIEELFYHLKPWVDQDLVWNVQLDTYKREIERYGLDNMEISESIFCYDSEAVLHFLALIEGEEGERLRWLFALRSIDDLLNCFDYDQNEKLELMESLKDAFAFEFNMSRPLKKQLDEKYRSERDKIAFFMKFSPKYEPDYEPITAILHHKRENITLLAQQISDLHQNGEPGIDKGYLLKSYIHMLTNRLFKSKGRLNEMVCYDFLFRYYKTEIALAHAKKNRPLKETN